MRRACGFDVLACPCGGRLRLLALIEEAAAIGRILAHLGLPTKVPTPRPARTPPRGRGVVYALDDGDPRPGSTLLTNRPAHPFVLLAAGTAVVIDEEQPGQGW
jgi:hypothetical protein